MPAISSLVSTDVSAVDHKLLIGVLKNGRSTRLIAISMVSLTLSAWQRWIIPGCCQQQRSTRLRSKTSRNPCMLRCVPTSATSLYERYWQVVQRSLNGVNEIARQWSHAHLPNYSGVVGVVGVALSNLKMFFECQWQAVKYFTSYWNSERWCNKPQSNNSDNSLVCEP
jgi:hypothetical protein